MQADQRTAAVGGDPVGFQDQLPADPGAEQPDRAEFAGDGGGESFAQEHALVDAQPVGMKGGTVGVAQLRPDAVEPAEVSAEQPDRALVAEAGRGESGAQVHVPVDLQPVGVQDGPAVLVSCAPEQSSWPRWAPGSPTAASGDSAVTVDSFRLINPAVSRVGQIQQLALADGLDEPLLALVRSPVHFGHPGSLAQHRPAGNPLDRRNARR